jgi:glycosyltransferase involved in cell wall biosynthesis
MKTRVCMIALTDYPGDQRVRREAEALVLRGDEVDVISPWTPSIGDRRELDGVRLHPLGALHRDSALGMVGYLRRDITFLVRAALAVGRLHRRRQYDVIHVHSMPDYLVFAALLPKLTGAKVVLDLHDLVPELYASKFGTGRLSRLVARVAKLVERRSVAFADGALSVHKPHLEALLTHGNPPEKFTIVMNSPDTRLFARREVNPPGKRPFTLIYHGTVSRRHGLDLAVRGVAAAARSFEDIRLEIVGDGDGIEDVIELVAKLGVDELVTVRAGRFPAEELQPLFERASAGVVPLTHDVFTRYMLPVKLLEYVAVGLPVISSRTDTVQSYFDETMVAFFEPGDADDLAAKIIELRANAEWRRDLVAGADRFLDQHSWARERERYYGAIDALVRRGGAGDERRRVESAAVGAAR